MHPPIAVEANGRILIPPLRQLCRRLHFTSDSRLFSTNLSGTGKQERSLAEMKKAHEFDPISQITNLMFTYVFYLPGLLM